MRIHSKTGFTLFELLIVMGVTMLIVVAVAPFGYINIQRTSIEGEVRSIISAIKRVQVRNKTGDGNKKYGIRLLKEKYVLFTGNSFETAESTTDVLFTGGNTIDNIQLTSSAIDITFETLSMKPLNSGIFIMLNTSDIYTVSLNSEGLLFYEKI